MNFAWEMGQSVLFAPMGNVWQGTWRCLRASLGDGVVVVLLFAGGWLVFGRRLWIVQSGGAGYVFVVILGVLIAAVLEAVAIYEGRWAYRPEMPTVPGLGIGLIPLLQMAVVPVIALRIAAAWELHHR